MRAGCGHRYQPTNYHNVVKNSSVEDQAIADGHARELNQRHCVWCELVYHSTGEEWPSENERESTMLPKTEGCEAALIILFANNSPTLGHRIPRTSDNSPKCRPSAEVSARSTPGGSRRCLCIVVLSLCRSALPCCVPPCGAPFPTLLVNPGQLRIDGWAEGALEADHCLM